MSVTASIKLKNGRKKAPQSFTYIRARKSLDSTAKKLKVQPPTSFEFEDPDYVRETVGSEYVTPKWIKRWETQKEWHKASLGLKTFRSLLDHYQARQDLIPSEVGDGSAFLQDLEGFCSLLASAAKRRDSFRIEALL
jgi:hypothetical protein